MLALTAALSGCFVVGDASWDMGPPTVVRTISPSPRFSASPAMEPFGVYPWGNETKYGTSMLLTADVAYFVNRTSGDGSLNGNMGAHCAYVTYSTSAPSIDVLFRGTENGNPPPRGAYLVRTNSPGEGQKTISGTGDEAEAHGFEADEDEFKVRSAFNESRTLFTLTFLKGRVYVNHMRLLSEDAVVKIRLESNETSPGYGAPASRFHVTELVRLSHHGSGPSSTRWVDGRCH